MNKQLFQTLVRGTVTLYEDILMEELKYREKDNTIFYNKKRRIVTEALRQQLIKDIEVAAADIHRHFNDTTH